MKEGFSTNSPGLIRNPYTQKNVPGHRTYTFYKNNSKQIIHACKTQLQIYKRNIKKNLCDLRFVKKFTDTTQRP